jgi:hypothetical protein
MWNKRNMLKQAAAILAALSLEATIAPCSAHENKPELLKAYLLDAEQLAVLYAKGAEQPVQKDQNHLHGDWYFYAVEVQNTGREPCIGTIHVNYEGQKGRPYAKHICLAPQMACPDYFVWLAAGGFVLPNSRFPKISAEWIPDEK